ncbi:MAG: hypothetical protein KKC75_05705 [Nanoarchaeota archaeon]|nr:hypothetical protein [Nanoarchaeota archaeon]MBU1004929.1 hypothetical protein [Nanoarchaeota archaeon]MBU1945625.1 hypothetical protein [Nanoarchaeota archaeon]
MVETVLQQNMNPDFFIEKKIELMMDMHSKKFANEITSIKEAINSLTKEISDIKRNLSEHKPTIRQEQIKKFEEPQPERQQATPSKGNARYGEYGPQDVSIEKFFYSGSNKR